MTVVSTGKTLPVRKSLMTFVLTVAATLLAITGVVSAQTVGAGPAFNNPRGIAPEGADTFIVGDFSTGNIFRVDSAGNRTIVSGAGAGTGVAIGAPAGVVVLPTAFGALTAGTILVADTTSGNIVAVDPVSGNRSVFAQGSVLDPANGLVSPFGIAFGTVLGSLAVVVTDTGGSPVIGPVMFDSTGTRIDILDDPTLDPDASTFYSSPRSVEVESSGTILVGNFNTPRGIIRVNPADGVRTPISITNGPGSRPGAGPGFANLFSMDIAPDGNSVFVVDFGTDRLVRVELASGNRSSVSSTSPNGEGVEFLSPAGIAAATDGFMLTDFGLPGLIRVNGASGDRSVFSSGAVVGFVGPRDLTVARDGTFIVAEFGIEAILGVNRKGDREVISDQFTGTGPNFGGPVGVIELPDGDLAVSDFTKRAIFRVNRSTGDRTLISGQGVGTGLDISARAFALDTTTIPARILGTSFDEDAVIAVNIENGDRTEISGPGAGSGDAVFRNPIGIDVADDGTIWVSEFSSSHVVVKVNPVDGSRTIVSDSANAAQGTAPIGRPFGLTVLDGGERILIASAIGGNAALFLVDPVTGVRTVVSGQGVGDEDSEIGLVQPFSVRSICLREDDDNSGHKSKNRSKGKSKGKSKARKCGKHGFTKKVVVSDFGNNSLIEVKLKNGKRKAISNAGRGVDTP